MEMVYIEQNGDERDTIRILIPSEKRQNKNENNQESNTDIVNNNGNSQPAESVQKTEDKKVSSSKEKKKSVTPVTTVAMINSDCKNFATEEDFLKLRKKMAAENDNENMVGVARKTFKTRCFTTEQIKNLSTLFLSDEGKYMFFDAAYPFVSDSESYKNLEGNLSDSYYINRFRAMIHK
jgi:hypothetical protein